MANHNDNVNVDVSSLTTDYTGVTVAAAEQNAFTVYGTTGTLPGWRHLSLAVGFYDVMEDIIAAKLGHSLLLLPWLLRELPDVIFADWLEENNFAHLAQRVRELGHSPYGE